MQYFCTFVFVLSACIGGYAPCVAAGSPEVAFPVPAYGATELKAVRDWEKQWAGRRVTTENVGQVKPFLHEAVYRVMREPAIMGASSLSFDVVAYRPYPVTRGMVAATRTYAPSAALNERQELIGYGDRAGIPFPRPENGTQMAWNFDANTKGDAHHQLVDGTVVDCRSGHQRRAGHLRWEMHWMGRYDVSPVPKILDTQNPRGIVRSFFSRHTAPPDFVDTTILELKYRDMQRETDLWIYTPMFRRIRRYATSQRTDAIDGTDMIYDDQDGWYTHLTQNTYAFLGRRDLLVARHQDPQQLTREKGQGFWNGIQRERCRLWEVEVHSRDPNYIYGKQIWYLDPETWQMNFKVMYNRQGQLWKMYEMFWNVYPGYDNQQTAFFNAEHIVDLIRRHGSPATREVRGVGIEIPLDMFQVRNLQKTTY